MAGLCGVNVDRTISLTFVMGAALAAVAGLMATLYYGVIDFFIGFLAGVKAFTAAVLGGIGSIPGAMLGGLVLGLIEAFWSGYFSIAVQGRGGVRHPGGGADLPADRPAGQARDREGLGRWRAPPPRPRRPPPGMAPALRDALLAAFVTFVLLAPMLGMRTASGPTGMTLEFHFEWVLPAHRDRVRRPAGCSVLVGRREVGVGDAAGTDRGRQGHRCPLLVARGCGPGLRLRPAVPAFRQPLRGRHRDHCADLRHARLGPEHRGRPRRPARPRLRRLLRGRRLLLRPVRADLRPRLLDLPAVGRPARGHASASCWAFRCCACAATIWPSSRWASARSSASSCSTGTRSPAARTACPTSRARASSASSSTAARPRARPPSTSCSASNSRRSTASSSSIS